MPENNTNTNKEWKESMRPGTVYRVFELYKKGELNAHGEKPVFVVPDVIEKKKQRSIN